MKQPSLWVKWVWATLLLVGSCSAFSQAAYPNKPIKIGAQLYLKKFYESFGFLQCSETYLEDDIPHIKMIRNQ